MNNEAERHPNVTIVFDDARSYFLSTDERFNVIVTDVTNLKYKGNFSVYSEECVEARETRLSNEGVAAA